MLGIDIEKPMRLLAETLAQAIREGFDNAADTIVDEMRRQHESKTSPREPGYTARSRDPHVSWV
jgi:hypothetical protein